MKLTEDVLRSACETFAIRRQWLDGADKQIYPLHDFYKHPEKFERFVIKLKNNDDRLSGTLMFTKEKTHSETALIIIEEIIGELDDRPVYRYHLCNNWLYEYWKSRLYLTICIAKAWKHDVYINARETSLEWLEQYYFGENFLDYGVHGVMLTNGLLRHPEYMALEPEAFLDGIDPEKNNYGIISGLENWIYYAKKGDMDTKLREPPIKEFQKELHKYVDKRD